MAGRKPSRQSPRKKKAEPKKKKQLPPIDENNNEDDDGEDEEEEPPPPPPPAKKGRKGLAGKKKGLKSGGIAPTPRQVESEDDDDSVEEAPINPKKKSRTDDALSDAESISQASQTTQKIKFKPKAIQLTPEVEADLIDWYESQPGLYQKMHNDHRKKDLRGRLMAEKAAQLSADGLDITAGQLCRWFASQRTMYVKERDRGRSGDGQIHRTERQQQRLQRMAFLAPHIVPKKRRQQIGVRKQFFH